VLPDRLRRRVRALGDATASFALDGPRIDADVLATIASGVRDAERLRFAYRAKDDAESRRHVEPAAVVHTGYRWYLAAWDLDRDDWRTFRVDRIGGRVMPAGRGRRREVPGGDPAAYVRRAIQAQDAAPVRGRVRVRAPVDLIARRVPRRYATVEPDGAEACLVTTTSGWSTEFVVWMATLDADVEVLEPPELVERTRAVAARLVAAA